MSERDRDIFEVLRLIRGLPHSRVATAAGVAPTTVANLRKNPKDGGTRYPRNETLNKILESQGYVRRIVKKEDLDE